MTDTRKAAEQRFEQRFGFKPRWGRDNAGLNDQRWVDEFEQNIADDRIQIGTETENQGPIGLLVSILRERANGGRY